MAKKHVEIMEILEAFDLTRCAESAAHLAGCDAKTVQRYMALRDAGPDPFRRRRRARLVDPYLEKVEEWVDHSHGKVRADVAYTRLVAMGFVGDERTVRRAMAEAKAAYQSGHRRTYRSRIPEPGMWLQYDWGTGPLIELRPTQLFCAWLAWSRYRVVLPTWDKTLGTVLACVDNTLQRLGGAPTYLLTDNERTLTSDRGRGCRCGIQRWSLPAAGGLPLWQELRQLARAGLLHTPAHPAGADDPGVGGPRREPGRLRTQWQPARPTSARLSAPPPSTRA